MSYHGLEAGHLHNQPTAELLSKDVRAVLIWHVNPALSSKRIGLLRLSFLLIFSPRWHGFDPLQPLRWLVLFLY